MTTGHPSTFPTSLSSSPSVPKQSEDLPTVLYKFVYAALSAKARRENPTNYNKLIAALSQKNGPDALERWYTALSKCTSLIGPSPEFENLTKIVLSDFDWKTTEGLQGPLEAYTNFVTNLSTSTSFFVVNILRILVKSFLLSSLDFGPTEIKKQLSITQTLSTEEDKADTVSAQVLLQALPVERLHDIVHATINRIHQRIPSCSSSLMGALVKYFPHPRRETMTHLIYVKNMLRVSENISVLRDSILTAIIERLIQLDVEINPKVEEKLGRRVDPEEEDLIFSLSLEDNGIGAEEEESKKEAHKVLIDKLDSLMRMLFDYLKLLSSTETTILSNEVFGALLRVFDRSILRTHKSRITQFLVYYVCSFKIEYSEKFLERLLSKIIDEETSMIERQSAAGYLASFLVRGTFVRQISVCSYYENLVKWLHKQVKKPIKNAPGKEKLSASQASAHGHIYSVFQAVMYIFTHRFELIAARESIHSKLKEWDFEVLFNSRHDPLKYCSQVVVMDFAVLLHDIVRGLSPTLPKKDDDFSHSYELKRKVSDEFFASPSFSPFVPQSSPLPFPSPPLSTSAASIDAPLFLLPESEASVLSSLSFLQTDQLEARLSTYRLDYFFPFDPYLLPNSLSYIQSRYYQFPLTSQDRLNKAVETLGLEHTFGPSKSEEKKIPDFELEHSGRQGGVLEDEDENVGGKRIAGQLRRTDSQEMTTSFSPEASPMILSSSVPLTNSLSTSPFIM